MLEGYGRNERLAIALAFVLALGYIGFRMWSAGTGLPTSVNQSYSIDYAGFSLEKSVAIGKGAHEERLVTRGGSPMVLLAVIPDVLEADAGNVRAAGSGKVEAISAYHLVVAQPKEGSASNSLSLSFKDSERNVSAIGLALPASFYAQLSDEQKTALYAELGKYALIEFPADKTRDLEGQLAKNLVGVLAQ